MAEADAPARSMTHRHVLAGARQATTPDPAARRGLDSGRRSTRRRTPSLLRTVLWFALFGPPLGLAALELVFFGFGGASEGGGGSALTMFAGFFQLLWPFAYLLGAVPGIATAVAFHVVRNLLLPRDSALLRATTASLFGALSSGAWRMLFDDALLPPWWLCALCGAGAAAFVALGLPSRERPRRAVRRTRAHAHE